MVALGDHAACLRAAGPRCSSVRPRDQCCGSSWGLLMSSGLVEEDLRGVSCFPDSFLLYFFSRK